MYNKVGLQMYEFQIKDTHNFPMWYKSIPVCANFTILSEYLAIKLRYIVQHGQ